MSEAQNIDINAMKPQIFCALPLRDMVMLPHMTTTIVVGREKSINGILKAKKFGMPIFAVTQTNPDHDDFDLKNIYQIGVVCNIIESIITSDGTLKVIIQGLVRGKVVNIMPVTDCFSAEVELLIDERYSADNKEMLGLIKGCVDAFSKYSEYNKRITPEVIASLAKVKSPYDIAYLICTYLFGDLVAKQKILAENDLVKKLYKTFELIQIQIEISKTEAKINKNIQEKITKNQKDFYLHEQLRNIKKELGQDEEGELVELKQKLLKLNLPKEVADKCNGEIVKLERMNLYSSEANVIRNYLDWITELPWHETTKPNHDLVKAQKILDKNHFSLTKIKERILEFIAVSIKTKELKGPIICLVGAPGVGKTSLAKSIADALNRKYVKVSLGGVKDESEVRGHRRTYIGSMPGRIIQSMKKAKVCNPLMLLDEIDKMSNDYRGDPAAALLEVLDPEQNCNFSDHYLELDYDLSKVMFIATANNIAGIPIPLRDRLEIIKLAGYTENEKLYIAKQHLIEKQLKENGLSKNEFSITDEAITDLIRKYTFEAGVRNLNREIANLARKAVKKIVTKEISSLKITSQNLTKYAGAEKYQYGMAKKEDPIGVSTGLAYSDFGGDLLDIETLKFEGSGKVQITGKLGEVMKESAQAAFSYGRFIAKELNIDPKKFNKYDFHIHVPEGATPKDGPSAGVALCVSLISCLAQIPIHKDIAMTGEITLAGKVLEIGGLKEKLLAALRGGMKKVLIPIANKKDLEEMPKEVLENLEIKPISSIKEALLECLVGYENFQKNHSAKSSASKKITISKKAKNTKKPKILRLK
jgi:ATP-dependent Lon protease